VPRPVVLVLGWLAAATVAVTVGVLAVSQLGASLQQRGPVGSDTRRFAEQAEGTSRPDPDAARVARTISGAFGEFEVACRGAVAYGEATTTRDGWQVVSYEEGPDDDVDAIFARRARSIEIEVYCNQGRPTIGDREVKTLPRTP
jgi:hypothetical protein